MVDECRLKNKLAKDPLLEGFSTTVSLVAEDKRNDESFSSGNCGDCPGTAVLVRGTSESREDLDLEEKNFIIENVIVFR